MKKQDLTAQGVPVVRAGPALLLRDIILEGEANESVVAAKSARNILKGNPRDIVIQSTCCLVKILTLMSWILKRSQRCGQHMMRVRKNENTHTIDIKSICFVALVMCRSLSGPTWKLVKCRAT